MDNIMESIDKSINHPIFDIQARVQVKSIDINKGKWTPKRDWQELIVEFKDGTILNKVRHKPYNFDVKVGQEIIIIWLVPNNDNSSWYYTKSEQTETDNTIINDRDQERLEQESEWKMLIEDVNPMSDDEREIFK